MAITIEAWRERQALRFHDEKKVLVKVLKERIAWHTHAISETDAAEQEAHLDLLERDEGLIEQIKKEHREKRDILNARSIEIPALEV